MTFNEQEGNTQNTTTKPKSSRFQFLESSSNHSEGRPNDLKKLQDQTLRRREEFRSNVQSIEDQIANLIDKLAEESLNREHAHSETLHRAVYVPTEQCMERVMSKLDNQACLSLQNQESFHSLRSIERKIMDLDMEASKLEYVTIPHAKDTCIHPLESIVNEDMTKTLRKESSKARQKELNISRQLEEIAGQTSSDMQGEKATRDTEIEVLNKEVKDQIYENEKRVTMFMDEIHEIQGNLDKEILDRKEQDQIILELILKTKKQLQDTVYETLGGGPTDYGV